MNESYSNIVKEECFQYKHESVDEIDDANITTLGFEEDIYCLAYIKMLNSDVP